MVKCKRCNKEMEYDTVNVSIDSQKMFITILYAEKVYRCPKCDLERYIEDYKAVDWR